MLLDSIARPASILLSLLAAGCVAPITDLSVQDELTEEQRRLLWPGQAGEGSQPPAHVGDGADWIRLGSGEWIKGQLDSIDRGTLEFDSEDLGDLKIDFEDVAELYSPRTYTLLLDGRIQLVGDIQLVGGDLAFRAPGIDAVIPRGDLVRMVPGAPGEASLWSGEVAVGGTLRRGNTDSLDATATFDLTRETALSRLPIEFVGAYGKLGNQQNTENLRLRARYDEFIDSRLYLTPLGIELYSDEFQNIDLRATPYTGLGYAVVDAGRVEWDLTAALGYRVIRFESVSAGQDDTEEGATALVGTKFTWEPTGTVEVGFSYSAEVGLEQIDDTNQVAVLELGVDLVGNLDLDVRLQWNRVGLPEPDAAGQVPDKDDVQLTVGLAWSF